MRFSVRWRHVCAGEERRTLRKSAFCTLGLTERRILYPAAHGKAHSAIPRSHRLRFSVTLRRPGGVRQPPASLRGGLCQSPQISVRSLASRKDAFWLLPHGKTHSPSLHHQNPQFDGSEDCRVRFSDRRMRFSDRRMRFSVTFRNHPDCIALSRHLRNPLTAPSHV